MLTNAWGHTPRPWGYEVRVDFTDDTGRIHNEVVTFPKEPDAKALEAAVTQRASVVTARIALEAAEALLPRPLTTDELVVQVAKLEAEKVVLTKALADAKAVK